MRKLRELREGWEIVQYEDTRLLKSLTILDSLNQWLMLQQAFEGQLLQTAVLFESERRAALIELQFRLHRIVDFKGG
jgi:hypothetical protein